MSLVIACALVETALYLLLGAAALHLLGAALWALRRGPLVEPTPIAPPTDAPFVTVQLPLRNEPAVAEGLLRCTAALDWPRDHLELQVLDDSNDETIAVVDRVAEELRQAGVAVEVLRRAQRTGYKAGALAVGLARARGELLLVLDADFRPEPQLLAQLHAALAADPALAFVQARWSFRNEAASLLTRLQAAILDALFTVEQARLSARGGPVQFNGTGGLWRRAAIERAGGWAVGQDALTEDLDLSFRAHEAGLRGLTLPALAVSTELPEAMSEFRAQQQRWVRGGALTLRGLGRRLLRTARAGDAITMLSHLARHARQPLLVAAALRLPLVAFGLARPIAPAWLGPSVIGATIATAGLYLGAAARRLARPIAPSLALGPSLAALSMGLSPALGLAFVGGLLGRTGGGFRRTLKLGDLPDAARRGSPDDGRGDRATRERAPRVLDLAVVLGLVLAGLDAAALGRFAQSGDVAGALGAAICALGCLWVAR